LGLELTQPVCLSVRGNDEAWRWHLRYGHIHFDALRKLAKGEMVRGLPLIKRVGQLCDSCLAGK
jgi:hypothetical protein